MIPLRDHNPTANLTIITYLIVAANILVWLFFQGAGVHVQLVDSLCQWGFVPGALVANSYGEWPSEICKGPPVYPELTLLSSMFMHGGWFHIAGNMWFLHIFGNNIEDNMGGIKFLILYLLAGSSAAGLQMLSNPESTVPMVGASGAIGGVMGAYMLLYPKALIDTLIGFGWYWRTIQLPAYFMLGFWVVVQTIGGTFANPVGGGVAYWAHVGGFVAGYVLALLFGKRE